LNARRAREDDHLRAPSATARRAGSLIEEIEPVGHFKSWLPETVTELATQSKPRKE
jgi:hypothetical protein